MKLLHIFIFLLLGYLVINAQNDKQIVDIPSPNAASLGIYGEIPISMFTGATNLNIPIYTLSEGDLELPISLSYNSTGVRPDVHPGWVGMNWSLNCGGMIKRVVKGIPDEMYYNEYYELIDYSGEDHNLYFALGYIFNTPLVSSSSWKTSDHIRNILLANGIYGSEMEKVDTEPDEFIFNVNGNSGKFYIGQDAIVVPVDDYTYILKNLTVIGNPAIQVELELYFVSEEPFQSYYNYNADAYKYVRATGQMSDIYSELYYFIITGMKMIMPDGTQYRFGYFRAPYIEYPFPNVDYSWEFFPKGKLDYRWDAWQLNQIKSTTNDSIDFEYTKYDSNENQMITASFTVDVSSTINEGSSTGFWFPFFGNTVSASNFKNEVRYNGRFISTGYLSKITSDNIEINFNISESNELKYHYSSIATDLALKVGPGSFKEGDYVTTFESIYGEPYEVAKYEYETEAREIIWGNPGLCVRTGCTSGYSTTNDVFGIFRWDYAYPDCDGYYCYNYLNGEYTIACPIVEVLDFRKLKWYQLDDIEIKKKNETSFREKYNFKYSNNSNQRLMLFSVQEEGTNGKLLPAYTFEYENYDNPYTSADVSHIQNGNTDPLPAYCKINTNDRPVTNVDHWGFFNGSSIKDPNFWTNFNFLDDDPYETNWKGKKYYDFREPDEDYIYSGILNRVNYPTGGYSQFLYEPNKYKRKVVRDETNNEFDIEVLSMEQEAGGLRIAEINSYDQYGNISIHKEYDYNEGILGGEIKYYWQGYQLDLIYLERYADVYMESDDHFDASRFISHTLLPVSENSAGGYVGYSKVTEQTEGNGRTEYYYTNYYDILEYTLINNDEGYEYSINDNDERELAPFNDKGFERGLLLNKKTYNENNNLVLDEENEYTANPLLSGNYIKAISTQRLPVFDDVYTIDGTAYKIYTYPYNLNKKIITAYDQNGNNPVTTTTGLNYNAQNFTNKETTYTSNGEKLEKNIFYPTDYPNSTNVFIADMKNANIINKSIEEYIVRDNQYITEGNLTTYKTGKNAGLPDRKYSLKLDPNMRVNNPFYPSNYYGAFNIGSYYIPDLIFDNYENGNIMQYHKDKGKYVSFIWGYNNKLPIAKIENSKYLSYYTAELEPEEINGMVRTAINECGLEYDLGTFSVSAERLVELKRHYIRSATNPQECYFNIYKDGVFYKRFHDIIPEDGEWITTNITLPAGNYEGKVEVLEFPYYYMHDCELIDMDMDVIVKQFAVQETYPVKHFAHTSFESESSDGWSLQGYATSYNGTNTGKKAYNGPCQSPPMKGGTYVVSFWAKGSPDYDGGVTVNGTSINGLDTEKGSYHTLTVTIPDNSRITFNNGYCIYDEIRIYPENAQITTYTYDPVYGMITATDQKNKTTHYEYDDMGRLKYIRDFDDNIIESYDYHYANE